MTEKSNVLEKVRVQVMKEEASGSRSSQVLVTRSSMPPFEEYSEMIRKLWESHWLTNMGELHQQLEHELKTYLGTSELTLFINGHMALESVLRALKLSGEVITTPFSFASTTHAIVQSGLTPVFADIRPEDYTIDPEKIEALITEKTSAILPVHVYGNICKVKEIQAIADRHGLKVIYDAAHAFGEWLNGESVASFGDASMFSFHATKVFHTIEGGAVAYQDHALEHALNGLKNFGIMDEETVELVGGNGKMNEFQAAMGLCNLRHIKEEIAKREKLYRRYQENLSGHPGIRLCSEQPGLIRSYSYMPVAFDGSYKTRDQVAAELQAQHIYPRKYFYPCINAYQCYRDRFSPEATPIAQKISMEILTLPLYADLSLEAVDRICRIILQP